eukprot:TRINITY_DN11316_c0_g1_i1.p1 TRINITY_DN11316_c0_g1~~TRINITY_DN11316_c0_g1_i1.p1  ORF type:complete len:563 (-),score=106.29 TRINITY_DN11316_c0_g1_i1:85-1773(-)
MRPDVTNGAWWTFCAGSFSCFLTGMTYTYGAWSPAVKKAYDLSQTDLNNLALAKDLGGFLCVDSGLVSSRCGPHVTLALGSLGTVVSSIAIWASLDGKTPYSVMVLLFLLFGHSLGYNDNAGIASSVANFPRQKGNAVGLMKALEGLTAAVMGTAFYTFFDAQTQLSYYPLLLALTASLIGFLAAPIMRVTSSPVTEEDSVVSKKFFLLTVSLLCYTCFCAVIGYAEFYNPATFAISFLGLFCMFILVRRGRSGMEESMNLLVNYPEKHQSSPEQHQSRTTTAPEQHQRSSSSRSSSSNSSDRAAAAAAAAAEQHQSSTGATPVERPNLSVSQMMTSIDFYLVFYMCIVLQGGGMMFANNMGQIVKAIQQDERAGPGLLITIFSVFNTVARVLFGFGSESLKGRINRPWFLVFSGSLMTAGLLFINLDASLLGLVAACIGFAMGGVFALQAVLVEELFGPKSFPAKYSCCFTAASFGSLIFSDRLAGLVYDAEARRQGSEVCTGRMCFALTFDVTAACSALAVCAGVALALRSRETYRCVNASLERPAVQQDANISLQTQRH